MPREIKLSKREQNKIACKKAEENLKKKRNDNSDNDSNSSSDSESEEEVDMHEVRKLIKETFPSKHINNKVKAGERLKKVLKNRKRIMSDEDDDDSEWVTSEEEEEELPKKKKTNKKVEDDSETLGSEDSNTEGEDEEESSPKKNKKGSKINIIFTIGEKDDNDDWEDDYDSAEDYDDYEDTNEDTENEDEEVSTDESSDEENDDNDECSNTDSDKKVKEEREPIEVRENKVEMLNQLKEMLQKNPKDKTMQRCVKQYEDDIKKETEKKAKKEKKQKAKNMRIFRKIMNDKNTMNDFAFYEKMEPEKQKKLIKELREINKITRIEKPYRMSLLEANIPIQFKAAALKKINSLKHMDPGNSEFYKIKNWVDTFMKIPFTNYHELPISIDDGVDKCHDFMATAQKTLDEAVYGLNDAKMQIMQMLGQLLTNPKAIGTAIAIHGPPGTGKTSLVKEGISRILGRPFTFIALGGATDSSFLEGHGYTYEGSTWGRIVQILIDSQCMNPVIYFDELDKISETPKGEEITGILTHLTDTTQNSQFHDKYFSEINFDLSKCLFIFSYNDESKVNPILRDRMYRIKTKGYSSKEKNIIANNYLLPRIREQVKFNPDDIVISDDVLGYINETLCQKEDGVRNMKRCLEIIHTKLNLYRLMRPDSNIFEGEMALKVEFPFKVTKAIVDKLIKKEQDNISALCSMYV